jgi:hypothetical protein
MRQPKAEEENALCNAGQAYQKFHRLSSFQGHRALHATLKKGLVVTTFRDNSFLQALTSWRSMP